MKTAQTKILALLALALALALSLAACGEKSEDVNPKRDPLTLTLDFYPNPDHAGIYVAKQQGYFDDAGLDLTIRTPTDPSTPIREVAAGKSDLAISYEPEVLLARDEGLDVKAVGAIVNQPLTSLIWLGDSGIKGVGGLRGKTVATAGIPYQDAYLKTILARANLSPSEVKSVSVGLGLLPALISGKAQAMLGGFSNIEGVDLQLRGLRPTVKPVNTLGVPTYDELVVVANPTKLADNPEPIRLFLAALARGTATAVSDPDTALAALKKANPGLDDTTTRAELTATLPLLAQGKGTPFRMNPAAWKTFIAWMRDNELISTLPAVGSVLSNDYLPGSISK